MARSNYNAKTFHGAISNTQDYPEQLRRLRQRQADAEAFAVQIMPNVRIRRREARCPYVGCNHLQTQLTIGIQICADRHDCGRRFRVPDTPAVRKLIEVIRRGDEFDRFSSR
jgi:hypothetical protein